VARIGGDVSLRERLLTEAGALQEDPVVMGFMAPERSYLLGDPPDYEPSGAASVTGIAAARGAGVWETFLDLLLADGGRELLNSPVLNYSDGNLDATREMLVHLTYVFGPGDGGATLARPATRRPPPSCSAIGRGTAGRVASRWRRPCGWRHRPPPTSTGWATGAAS